MSLKLVVILVAILGVVHSCDEHRDCVTCTQRDWGFYWISESCRWCPLTDTCHAPYSPFNKCPDEYQFTEPNQCYNEEEEKEEEEPTIKYDSSLAEELAKWSSLAYVPPQSYDRSSIESAVSELINSSYQVVEFLTIDCDNIFEFDHCAAVIATSSEHKRIVVAFEGTSSPGQLAEQFIFFSLGGKTRFHPTGGEVMEYNKRTHDRLYPCVKSLLLELTDDKPGYEVVVTGHSLGGSQAQLAAAHLLSDGVVSQSKLLVYTFGSPRVGDKEFALGYNEVVKNSWRVMIKDDPIPNIVPGLFAYHTEQGIFYNTEGTISPHTRSEECDEDEPCMKDICLSIRCFTERHQQYFLHDLPDFIRGNMSAATGNQPNQRSRGQCRSHIIG